MKKQYYVLGLDLGVASCGVGLIDTANEDVLLVHSHLFPQPIKPKDKTSLAKERREHRSVRKNIRRKANRKKICIRLFREEKLVSPNDDARTLQTKKGDKDTIQLRAEGLDRLLSKREWAQVLYGICGRRGYIANGEDDDFLDNESGKMKIAITENKNRLGKGNFRTVGEMFASKERSRNREGQYDFCVFHNEIVQEVHKLFKAQRSFGNAHSSESFEDAYLNCLNWKYPNKGYDEKIYDAVGECVYYSQDGGDERNFKRKRAPKASITSEELNLIEKLCNIRIIKEDLQETTLTANDILRIYNMFFGEKRPNRPKKMTYLGLRKELGLGSRDIFKCISRDNEKNDFYEPKAFNKLLSAFIKKNSNLANKILNQPELGDVIAETLTFASTLDSLKARLNYHWDGPDGLGTTLELTPFSSEEKEIIFGLPFNSKLFSGYGKRSLWSLLEIKRAYLNLLKNDEVPVLADIEKMIVDDNGQTLFELRMQSSMPTDSFLPSFSDFNPTCNNPVVLRAMSQMRKIVNSVIKLYGPLSEIHIEVSRDLKLPKKEKNDIKKKQALNKQLNDEAKLAISMACFGDENHTEEASGKQITKYKLYKWQHGKDPYTGLALSLDKVLSDEKYSEIDHILPFSRTANDSLSNKVLVLTESNQKKGNRTPKEWFDAENGVIIAGGKRRSWEQYVAEIQEEPYYKGAKQTNLLETNLDEKEASFINRNLNDTRYMSRIAMDYLETCLSFDNDEKKRHVYAVTGQTTSMLRKAWKLNKGKKEVKDRKDARHHGVDAAIIAATSIGTIQKFACSSSHDWKKEDADTLSRRCRPWDSFSEQVLKLVKEDIPTSMVLHKGTGEVLQASFYGFEGLNAKGLGILKKKGMEGTAGNYILTNTSKTAQKIGEQAYLALWWDQNANKGRGGYLIEPVFYSDLPSYNNPTFKHRYYAHKPRTDWPIIPPDVLKSKPIKIFRDDVVQFGDTIGRYVTINISNKRITMRLLVSDAEIAPKSPSLLKKDEIKIINQDCLGLSFKKRNLIKEVGALEDLEY